MSLFDRITPLHEQTQAPASGASLGDRLGARFLTEQTGSPKAPRRLWEDMVARPLRFFSPRDIQYAIEDLTTASERYQDSQSKWGYFRPRKGGGGACEDEKKGKTLLTDALKELRGASSVMKKYADHCEAD